MSLRFLRFLETGAPPAVLLIRLVVGGIFLSEGIQKFLSPDALGAGRFAAIGILAPGITGPFVGGLEIIGGILLLLGLGTRLIAITFLIEMSVAILSTKIPILLGHGYWHFTGPKAESGFWAFAHESRTDIAMLLGTAFLLIEGAGRWSLDAWLTRRS